jgi:hypothetical protein
VDEARGEREQARQDIALGARPSRDIMSAMTSARVKKVMTQPINLIFRFLQNRTRIQIWLYEQTSMRIEVRRSVRAEPTTNLCDLASRRRGASSDSTST